MGEKLFHLIYLLSTNSRNLCLYVALILQEPFSLSASHLACVLLRAQGGKWSVWRFSSLDDLSKHFAVQFAIHAFTHLHTAHLLAALFSYEGQFRVQTADLLVGSPLYPSATAAQVFCCNLVTWYVQYSSNLNKQADRALQSVLLHRLFIKYVQHASNKKWQRIAGLFKEGSLIYRIYSEVAPQLKQTGRFRTGTAPLLSICRFLCYCSK